MCGFVAPSGLCIPAGQAGFVPEPVFNERLAYFCPEEPPGCLIGPRVISFSYR